MCKPRPTRRHGVTKIEEDVASTKVRDDLHSSGMSVGVGKSIEDPIERLNFIAQDIARRNPPSEEFKLLLREPTSFWESSAWCVPLGKANPIVYQHRFKWFFVLHVLHSMYWIARFMITNDNGWWLWPVVLLPLAWAFGDFYGGVLHVVLDTPSNIPKPLIGLPSLEFQLHHAIPQDIVVKGILEVCSDLNTIATWNMIFSAVMSGCDPLAMAITSSVLLAAYAGQASHQATHKLPKQNSAFVKFLQRNGIFLKPQVHRSHHQTHDKDFCILSGWTNSIISNLLKVIPQSRDHVWLGAFLALTVGSSPVLTSLTRTVIGPFL